MEFELISDWLEIEYKEITDEMKEYTNEEDWIQAGFYYKGAAPDFFECIEFLNKMYDLTIDPNDQYNSIVEQIMEISVDTPSAGILKRKVASADSIDDIIRAVRLHMINNLD